MKKRLLLGFLTLLMALGVLFGVAACTKAVNDLSLDRSDQPQTTYVLGTELDLTKGTLMADGTAVPLNADGVTVTGYDKNTLGQQTLTVTFGDKTVQYTVTVVPRFRTAEEYVYFVGEEFSDVDVRINITRDDGTTIPVSSASEGLTVTGFSSAEPKELTLNAVYEKDGERYEGSFSVRVTKPQVRFQAPRKTEYGSHETRLDMTGASVRLTDPDGDTVRNVALNALTTTGFAPDAVTKEHPETVTQHIQVLYRGQEVGTFDVTVAYSAVSRFRDAAEELSKLDWRCYRAPTTEDPGMAYPAGTTQEQKTLAVEQLTAYLGMSTENAAYITLSELEAVARLAVTYGYNTWREQIGTTFKDVFTVDSMADITFVCDAKSKAEAGITLLEDEDVMAELKSLSTLLANGTLLNKCAETVLYTGFAGGSEEEVTLTVADLASLIPDASYFTDVKEVLKWAIDAFEKGTAAEMDADGAYDRIMEISNRKYTAEIDGEKMELLIGNTSILSMMNEWHAEGDFFDPLYRHYYTEYREAQEAEDAEAANSAMTHIDNLSALMFPQPLEALRLSFLNGQDMQTLMQQYAENYMTVGANELLVESTLFIYLYEQAIAESSAFLNAHGDDEVLMTLYNTYFATVLVQMMAGSYGYWDLRDASAFDADVQKVWDLYLDAWYFDDTGNAPAGAEDFDFDATVKEMFEAFCALLPTQQYYFLLSMNYLYGSLPEFALYPEDGYLYSYFATFIYTYYGKQLGIDFDAEEENTARDLFYDLMLAIEYYANGDTENFCITMKDAQALYTGWTDADAKEKFDSYLKTVYDRYTGYFARFTENTEAGENEPAWSYTEALTDDQKAVFDALNDAVENASLAQYYIDGVIADLGGALPLYVPFLASYEKVRDYAAQAKAANEDAYYFMPYISEGSVKNPSYHYVYQMDAKYELYFLQLGIDKAEYEAMTGLRAFLKEYEGYFWYVVELMMNTNLGSGFTFDAATVSAMLMAFRALTPAEQAFLLTLDNLEELSLNLFHGGLERAASYLFVGSKTAQDLVSALLNVQIGYIGYQIATESEQKEELRSDILTSWQSAQTLYEQLKSEDAQAGTDAQADESTGAGEGTGEDTDEDEGEAITPAPAQSAWEAFNAYFGEMYKAYAQICASLTPAA